jgi:hypothetical protein
MNDLEKIKALRVEMDALCARIMANPEGKEEEFEAAFHERDINYVESQMDGMTEEEKVDYLAEVRWETGCGCNGADSPYHSYFGME